MRALEAQGRVGTRPRQGYCVRPKSEEEMQDLFETRLVLEPAAAALAAERRSAAQMPELREIVARSQRATRARHGAALARANPDFPRPGAPRTGQSVPVIQPGACRL